MTLDGLWGNFHPTTISQSTISGNTASLSGGGVYNRRNLLLEHSIVTENEAPNGAGVAGYETVTTVHSSIIAGNIGTDVESLGGAQFVSGGFNIIGTSNVTNQFNQAGDQTGVANPLQRAGLRKRSMFWAIWFIRFLFRLSFIKNLGSEAQDIWVTPFAIA